MFEDIINKIKKIKTKFVCPICDYHGLEIYNISPDDKSGKDNCPNCGRNTSWSLLPSISDTIWDILKRYDPEKMETWK